MDLRSVRSNCRLTAAELLLFLGLASAACAHDASTEVGHWLGFAQSSSGASSRVVLDLTAVTGSNPFALQGTISGLPAVQITFQVNGIVTPEGQLRLGLFLPGTAEMVGFCDGSVRPILNFGPGSGQDDLGSLNVVLASASSGAGGHLNLLHMFGGAGWQMVGINWGDFGGLPGFAQSTGAFMRPHLDVAGPASFSASQEGGATSSAFTGGVRLADFGLDMVGTANSRGTIVMMCDGSVTNGGSSSLIGLLFTGAMPAPVPGTVPTRVIVGNWGAAAFDQL